MTTAKRLFIMVLVMTALHPIVLPRWIRAQSFSKLELDPDRVMWNQLSFHASKFNATLTSEVQLAFKPTSETTPALIASTEGTVLNPSEPEVLILSVRSMIDAPIGSDENLVTQTWTSPQNATAFQRIRLRRGEDMWQKIYRFTREGVFRLRRIPNDDQEKQHPPDRWTQLKKTFYHYPPDQSGCPQVLETSGIIYFVSAAALSEHNNPLDLCVFNKQQLHQVRVRVKGREHLKVNYLEKYEQKVTPKDESIEVVKISFEPRALVIKGQESRVFSFLGLKGNFDIYIEKNSRIPVQITGKLPIVGNIDIKLHEVRLGMTKDE